MKLQSAAIASGKRAIAYIGLGTNLATSGLSLNLDRMLHLLRKDPEIQLVNTSSIYETKPMEFGKIVTSQDNFFNCVVKLKTSKSPQQLLTVLKQVEAQMGRDFTARRHGPRVADLDLLMYADDETLDLEDPYNSFHLASRELTVPHVMLNERDFVLMPLREVMSPQAYEKIPRKVSFETNETARTVLGTVACFGPYLQWRLGENVSKVIAIMNATPDSFSDGGTIVDAAKRAHELVHVNKVDALDVGGESTRPGADKVPLEVELERVIPVIESVLRVTRNVSVDTYKVGVAREAIKAGVTVVNDVTGGEDPSMLELVAESPGVSLILMHSRSDSKATDFIESKEEKDVVSAVAADLQVKIDRAIKAGIPRWRLIVDPGIGFAKTHQDSFALLTCSNDLRAKLGGNIPVMIGHSRKRFLKPSFLGIDPKEEWPSVEVREQVNAMATRRAMETGADMVRVHF